MLITVNALAGLNPIKPTRDLPAASWPPVYLLGLGAVVYGSAWDNLQHPWFGASDVRWELGILAGFSFIVYFWAMAVALPAEEIQSTIDKVLVPEETVLAVSSAPRDKWDDRVRDVVRWPAKSDRC